MTMHLCGPALTMTGKRKGKQKFRNAEEARKARELAADWQELQAKWGVTSTPKRQKSKPEALVYKLSAPIGRNTTTHIPSLSTGEGIASSKPSQRYTGTLIKGIATMHKSNAVPVLNDEDAIAISKMRRG